MHRAIEIAETTQNKEGCPPLAGRRCAVLKLGAGHYIGDSKHLRWIFAAVSLMVLLIPSVFACDLPVFRWALENWAASPYEIIVYHEGTLAAEQQQLIVHLRNGTTKEGGLGNATITLVDITQAMDPFFEDLWKNQKSPEVPWMVVRYPHSPPNPACVWSGALSAKHIAALLDSPARREIAKRLGNKNTAVWVFLKTGDVKRDAGRLETLEQTLQAMTKTIEIKPLDIETNEDAKPVPWDLKFSVLPIDRNDPAEQPFIQMLLKSEGDLSDIDAPMAFPIFARGRALYALTGDGISARMIEEACLYIAGRCTCEVKDRNPGIDLLMSTNWDKVVGKSMMPPIEPPGATALTALQLGSDRVNAAADDSPSAAVHNTPPHGTDLTPADNDSRRSMAFNIAIVMAVAFVVVIIATAFILFKIPSGNE